MIKDTIIGKLAFIKLITLMVRGLGIGSRFLLMFLITKYISLEFQGEYTLVVSTITLLIIFFGFDFYVYTGRLIIKESKNEVFFLKNMLVFCAFSYLILMVFLWTCLNLINLEIAPFWLLYFLIVFEHLGQEFFRMYLALRKPLLANILLFIRTGLWASIIVFGFIFIEDFTISIIDILSLWFICAVATCVLGFSFYPKIQTFFKVKIDYKWIKKGVMVGLTMFASTICLKIIEYSDRYLIALFLDKKDVGIYAFYFQLANIINVIIFTMYISFLYPDIVKGVYDKSYSNVKNTQKAIKSKTLYIAVFFGIVFTLFSSFFLDYINKPELNDYILLYYIMLLSSVFLNYSFTSHYVIIGEEKENLIFKATFLACIFNIILNLALIPLIGIYGSAIALLTSNVILLGLKRKYEKSLVSLWE